MFKLKIYIFRYRLLYLFVSGFGQRIYYYLAWTIGDTVNNASGFGFNGYDESGKAKWDLLINLKILDLEVNKIKTTVLNVSCYVTKI